MKHLEQRDSGFRQDLARCLQQFRDARTPAERDTALQQLRRSAAGKLGELIATDGLKPFFDKLELQRRVENSERYDLRRRPVHGSTQPDGVRPGPRGVGRWQPVCRGEDGAADVPRAGGTTHLGSPSSRARCVGRQDARTVSRDVYAMSGERAARDTVAEAGSYVMALLPEKRVIDEALVRLLRDRMGRA